MSEIQPWLSSSPGLPSIDLNADYRKAQEAGHHPDCDGFRQATDRCNFECKQWDEPETSP